MNLGMLTNSLRSDDTSPNPLNLHGEASFQKSRTLLKRSIDVALPVAGIVGLTAYRVRENR